VTLKDELNNTIEKVRFIYKFSKITSNLYFNTSPGIITASPITMSNTKAGQNTDYLFAF
jgi:hypothetical protein